MRPSPQRAAPVPTRDTRLREAGLSGARALTRLLVALIEGLGQHDKAGRRHPADWPHGSTRSAYGPSPLGDELDRVMRARPNPVAPQTMDRRDAVSGRSSQAGPLARPTSADAAAPSATQASRQRVDARHVSVAERRALT